MQRRDGTVLEWPNMVLGARDAAAPFALRAYADKAEEYGYDPQYVAGIRALADEFDAYFGEQGPGDPDAPRHRKDDLETIAKMRTGKGAKLDTGSLELAPRIVEAEEGE